jgi:transposase
MASKRKQYTSEFKFKVVMESFQRDTTIEAVCRKFDVSSSVVSRGLQEFPPFCWERGRTASSG